MKFYIKKTPGLERRESGLGKMGRGIKPDPIL